MTRATGNRGDMAAAVVSLAAEAAQLEAHADELRRQIVDLDERMEAVADALHRLHGTALVN